jgi:hypothetical protein
MMANEKLLTDFPLFDGQLTSSMLPGNFTASYRLHVLTQADHFQSSSEFLRFVAKETHNAQTVNDEQDKSISALQEDYVSKSAEETQRITSSLDVGGEYLVKGQKVVGQRDTGWRASTGKASKAGINGSITYTVGASYSQSQVLAIAKGLEELRQWAVAMQTALGAASGHGLINE